MARLAIDHLFAFVEPDFVDSAEAAALGRLGLILEFGRVHAGQGTANRLVLFPEEYLEFLWLADREEAERNRLRLDRRADWRDLGGNPFGVGLRGRLDPELRKRWFWPYSLTGMSAPIWIAELSAEPRWPMLFVIDDDREHGPRSRGYAPELLVHPGGQSGLARATLRCSDDWLGALGPLAELLPTNLRVDPGQGEDHLRVELHGPDFVPWTMGPMLLAPARAGEPSAGTGLGAVAWTVPAGCEAVLDRLLRLGLEPGQSWSLVDWAARRTWIDARYRGRHGELAIVRLYPRDRNVPVDHRKTERFTVALVRGHAPGLLTGLARHLAVHEPAFEWQRVEPSLPPRSRTVSAGPPAITDPRELDGERTAFELGLKPAIRQLLDPRDAPWAAAMFVRGGAAVAAALAGLPHSHAVLMVAPTLADARAMLDAELVQFERDDTRSLDGARELGRRLGYPPCCVEAFLAKVSRAAETKAPELGRDNWQRVDAAWVARPNPRINSLLFGELLGLISFDPCRFDCPAAAQIANALFERLAQSAPVAAAALDRQLARPVFIDEQDRRAWLELESDLAGRTRVRAIEVIRLGWDHPDPAALAGLIGQGIDEHGRMPDLPDPRHRVFRFDLGRIG